MQGFVAWIMIMVQYSSRAIAYLAAINPETMPLTLHDYQKLASPQFKIFYQVYHELLIWYLTVCCGY